MRSITIGSAAIIAPNRWLPEDNLHNRALRNEQQIDDAQAQRVFRGELKTEQDNANAYHVFGGEGDPLSEQIQCFSADTSLI